MKALRCESCGAPLETSICVYCGTRHSDVVSYGRVQRSDAAHISSRPIKAQDIKEVKMGAIINACISSARIENACIETAQISRLTAPVLYG